MRPATSIDGSTPPNGRTCRQGRSRERCLDRVPGCRDPAMSGVPQKCTYSTSLRVDVSRTPTNAESTNVLFFKVKNSTLILDYKGKYLSGKRGSNSHSISLIPRRLSPMRRVRCTKFCTTRAWLAMDFRGPQWTDRGVRGQRSCRRGPCRGIRVTGTLLLRRSPNRAPYCRDAPARPPRV